MTPRSFWIIVIKIIGICIFYQLLTNVWQTISATVIFSTVASVLNHHEYEENTSVIGVSGLILLLSYILMVYSFIFKTNWVINKLRLDKGYQDEKFEFNLQRSTVLKIAFFIVGIWLLVNIIPDLAKELFLYFNKPDKFKKFEYNRNTTYIIADAVKVVIGLCIVVFSNAIVNFIIRTTEKNSSKVPEE
jgi:hypothetical protein